VGAKDLTQVERHIFLCNGTACNEKGAEGVVVLLRQMVKEIGMDTRIHTTRTRCNGRCDDGPIVIIQPDGVWYGAVTPSVAQEIVLDHLSDNLVVDSHILYRWGASIITSQVKPRP